MQIACLWISIASHFFFFVFPLRYNRCGVTIGNHHLHGHCQCCSHHTIHVAQSLDTTTIQRLMACVWNCSRIHDLMKSRNSTITSLRLLLLHFSKFENFAAIKTKWIVFSLHIQRRNQARPFPLFHLFLAKLRLVKPFYQLICDMNRIVFRGHFGCLVYPLNLYNRFDVIKTIADPKRKRRRRATEMIFLRLAKKTVMCPLYQWTCVYPSNRSSIHGSLDGPKSLRNINFDH